MPVRVRRRHAPLNYDISDPNSDITRPTLVMDGYLFDTLGKHIIHSKRPKKENEKGKNPSKHVGMKKSGICASTSHVFIKTNANAFKYFSITRT